MPPRTGPAPPLRGLISLCVSAALNRQWQRYNVMSVTYVLKCETCMLYSRLTRTYLAYWNISDNERICSSKYRRDAYNTVSLITNCTVDHLSSPRANSSAVLLHNWLFNNFNLVQYTTLICIDSSDILRTQFSQPLNDSTYLTNLISVQPLSYALAPFYLRLLSR